MNLVDIPAEVLSHVLFPNLDTNDLLRLRKVGSHVLKLAVDDHFKEQVKNEKTYFIGQGTDRVIIDNLEGSWYHYDFKSMQAFLQLAIPITPRKFYFDFRPHDHLFSSPEWILPEFLNKYGRCVNHLSLSELTLPLNGDLENHFFNAIEDNLKHLTVERIHFRRGKCGEHQAIPTFFRNLETLNINILDLNGALEITELRFFWRIVQSCTQLETFLLPRYLHINQNQLQMDQRFRSLGYQQLAHQLLDGHLNSLKVYNLRHLSLFDAHRAGMDSLMVFCTILASRKVKIIGIDCRIFSDVTDPQDLGTIETLIIEMRNYCLRFGGLTFPNMKKLVLETLTVEAVHIGWNEIYQTPLWPDLEFLKLTINSNVTDDDRNTEVLFGILFEGVLRDSVRTLELAGDEGENEIILQFPDLGHVGASCHNVTTLVLQHWNAPDDQYAALWVSLPHLQSVTLLNCATVGINAFTGGNEENPVFLRLQALRTFRLQKVQNMQNITDEFFDKIVKHLPLKEFVLESYTDEFLKRLTEITSFTDVGINSLSSGQFANSIGKFPYKNWILQGYSREMMQNLVGDYHTCDVI